jgi:hypothetical protein
MQIIDPAIQAALANIGCITNNGLDNTAYATLLAADLETNHVAADVADIANAETSVGDLIAGVVGLSDDQLLNLTKPLLAVGVDGRVQKALTNGHVLCSRRTRVTTVVAGEQKTVNIATRFLTADSDVIKEYGFEARRRRLQSVAESAIEFAELVEARNPGMATDVADFLADLTATLQNALTPGSTP